MEISFAYILSLLFRGLILGSIVFAATTYIPSNLPSMRNRLIISAAVVILYALIDYIQTFLLTVRNVACDVACGYHSGAKNDLEIDSSDLTSDL